MLDEIGHSFEQQILSKEQPSCNPRCSCGVGEMHFIHYYSLPRSCVTIYWCRGCGLLVRYQQEFDYFVRGEIPKAGCASQKPTQQTYPEPIE